MAVQHTHTAPRRAGHGSARVPPPQTPHARRHAAKRDRTQPRHAPVGSRPRLANQHPPLANGRSTHTPHRRAGHGSARVPSQPPHARRHAAKTQPNATTPGTRGLPPTARLNNAEHSPPQATLRPPQASRARKCPGASQTAACTQTRRKNATERNHAKHPWASAHGSPSNGSPINGSPGHPDAPESHGNSLSKNNFSPHSRRNGKRVKSQNCKATNRKMADRYFVLEIRKPRRLSRMSGELMLRLAHRRLPG
jgi:hypothetical protein